MLVIPLSGIKKIEEIAKSSEEYISLSQGSIKVGGIPQQIKAYVQELLNTDKTDYYESCWGIRLLRETIASTLSECYFTNITINQVLPTHGCIGGLSLLYLSLLNPGDEVIVPEPAYPAYALLAQAARSNCVYVSLDTATTDSEVAWKFDIEKIKAATTDKTKIIVFSNPCNPLGMVIPLDTIKELLVWCEQRGIYLIVDEAYRDYAFTPVYESALSLINTSDRLICANTFSKNMAMSGWRIGYLVIPEALNKPLAGMQDALLNCLNNTAQFAAVYALQHPEFTQKFHSIVKANLDMTMTMLKPLLENGVVTYNRPDGGFFVFLKTNQKDASDLCMSILHQAKVALIPGKSFGPSASPFLRLCYARDSDYLQEGLDRLIKFFM